MREFLIAICMVSDTCHWGQSDPWYARGCLAREYLRRWYQIRDIWDWLEQECICRKCKARAMWIYRRLMIKHQPDCPRWPICWILHD